MQAPSGYYTATTTKKKLGISDGMLRTYINRQLIERMVPPGRSQGFYKQEGVDKLAEQINPARKPAIEDKSLIANYLFEMGHLKLLSRSGWWRMGVKNPESVAEHSFRTAIIGYILASLNNANPEKVACICLFHDVAETRIGDLSWTAKSYLQHRAIKEGEQLALHQQTAQLPQNIADRILSLVNEYEDRSSLEANLVREADLLECLLQAREYQEAGYTKGFEWAKMCFDGLQNDIAKELAEACLNGDPGDWFEDIQTNPNRHKSTQTI